MRTTNTRRNALLLVLALLATLTVSLTSSSTPAVAAPNFEPWAGITVNSVHPFSDRGTHVNITTPAVDNGTLNTRTFHDVSILLPNGYNPQVEYPVLYLLHGRGGGNGDWLVSGGADPLTANLPLIVVMPQAGRAGWGTNWVDQSQGAQQWDEFHLDQLIPWIDHNLSTIDHKNGRAIAGFSMGGAIAIRHAAHRPGLFAFAGGFSGGYDFEDVRMRAVIDGSLPLEGFAPGSAFGAPWDPAWAFNNPWHRAEAFRDIHTVLYAGTNWSDPVAGTLERESHAMSYQFWQRLQSVGATSSWFLEYNDGSCGHHYGCASEALSRELGPMMDVLWGP